MPSSCVAFGCSNKSGTNLLSELKFFRFPVDPKRKKAWITAVNRENWKPSASTRLCSAHFITGKPSALQDESNVDWAPSVNMGYDCSASVTGKNTNRKVLKPLITEQSDEDVLTEQESKTEKHCKGPSFLFTVSSHADYLLKAFSTFRNNSFFRDVTLRTKNSLHGANRLVLAAASPFFNELFKKGEYRDCKCLVVTLPPCVTKKGLEPVLKFIYSGNLRMFPDTVQDIFQIAWLFRMELIIKLCEQYCSDNRLQYCDVTVLSQPVMQQEEVCEQRDDTTMFESFPKVSAPDSVFNEAQDKELEPSSLMAERGECIDTSDSNAEHECTSEVPVLPPSTLLIQNNNILPLSVIPPESLQMDDFINATPSALNVLSPSSREPSLPVPDIPSTSQPPIVPTASSVLKCTGDYQTITANSKCGEIKNKLEKGIVFSRSPMVVFYPKDPLLLTYFSNSDAVYELKCEHKSNLRERCITVDSDDEDCIHPVFKVVNATRKLSDYFKLIPEGTWRLRLCFEAGFFEGVVSTNTFLQFILLDVCGFTYPIGYEVKPEDFFRYEALPKPQLHSWDNNCVARELILPKNISETKMLVTTPCAENLKQFPRNSVDVLAGKLVSKLTSNQCVDSVHQCSNSVIDTLLLASVGCETSSNVSDSPISTHTENVTQTCNMLSGHDNNLINTELPTTEGSVEKISNVLVSAQPPDQLGDIASLDGFQSVVNNLLKESSVKDAVDLLQNLDAFDITECSVNEQSVLVNLVFSGISEESTITTQSELVSEGVNCEVETDNQSNSSVPSFLTMEMENDAGFSEATNDDALKKSLPRIQVSSNSFKSCSNSHSVKELDKLFCEFCPASFDIVRAKQGHLKRYHPGKLFKIATTCFFVCDVCDQKFESLSWLYIHRCRFHNWPLPLVVRRYYCGLCFMVHRSFNQVKGHFEIAHSEERRHMCEHCGHCFRSASVLYNHIYNVHSNDYAGACEICGKTWKGTTALRQHMYIHTGEKPFACPDCDYRSAVRCNLKTHMQKHHNKTIESLKPPLAFPVIKTRIKKHPSWKKQKLNS